MPDGTTTTANTTTPQPNTTTAAPAATTAPPPAATDWKSSFQGEDAAWLSNKGFQSVNDVVNSARNAEKLLGVPQDRVLKLAEKMRDDKNMLTPEARAIYERLGAPKEAKDYQLDIPKEYGDPQLAESFRKIFHEEGIPKASAERIVKDWNSYMENQRKAVAATNEQKAKEADAILRKEWGAAYDQNLNIAKEGAKVLGLDQTKIDALHNALGQADAMKFIVDMGKKVGEGRYVPGTSTNTVMEPNTAAQEIRSLYNDKDFVRRYNNGDREAFARMSRLQEMAHPGDYRLGQDTARTGN